MSVTSIEWTDRTWNPIRGCSRVSPGCVNCYAERTASRFVWQNVAGEGGELQKPGPFHGFVTKVNGHAAWTGKVELIEAKLEEPLHWRKPCRVFVNSMSDLFHEALSFEDIDKVFTIMVAASEHTYQILTKRPARMLAYFRSGRHDGGNGPNRADYHLDQKIWLGVSAEDQQRADERIPLLLRTPAVVRFVSYEPALGPVDFTAIEFRQATWYNALEDHDGFGLTGAEHRKLDWIIAGAESGPGARPFSEDWARSARDQCTAAKVAFFYKQDAIRGHKIGTPELDGRRWMQFPK